MLFRISMLLLGLVATLIGAVAYTHWSLHQLTTPLPSDKALLDLLSTDAGPVSIHYVVTASLQDEDRGDVVFPAFVLRWADGRQFMIDAGMNEDGANSFYRKMGWQYKSDGIDSNGNQVALIAEHIDGLGLTHLHEDHVQGVVDLCQSSEKKIPLYQTEAQAMKSNYTTLPGVKLIETADCVVPTKLGSEGALQLIPDFPGLGVFAVAGHSPGSSVFVAAVEGKLWLIAGDVSWKRDALLGDKPKQVSWFRALFIPEDQEHLREVGRWLTRLEENALVNVVLCHDGDALRNSGISILKDH